MDLSWIVAVLLGILQGVLEWLPISSEGNISFFLTFFGVDPINAVELSLFLHMGTGIAAFIYYRSELSEILKSFPNLKRGDVFNRETADLSFLIIAVLVSGIVGIGVYVFLEEFLSRVASGMFILLIGALLLFTGLLQRFSEGYIEGKKDIPTGLDAFFVGTAQGLALLPGVSRSGTTVSVFLLRGYEEETALSLSFVLAIPASFAASVLVFLENGGVPSMEFSVGLLALIVSAVFGYFTIDILMKFVRKVSFWIVCVIFGVLMVLGSFLYV